MLFWFNFIPLKLGDFWKDVSVPAYDLPVVVFIPAPKLVARGTIVALFGYIKLKGIFFVASTFAPPPIASESAAESASNVYPVKSTFVIVLLPFIDPALIPPTLASTPLTWIALPTCKPEFICAMVTVASPEVTFTGFEISFFWGTEALCKIAVALVCLNFAWCITKDKSSFIDGNHVTPFCE